MFWSTLPTRCKQNWSTVHKEQLMEKISRVIGKQLKDSLFRLHLETHVRLTNAFCDEGILDARPKVPDVDQRWSRSSQASGCVHCDFTCELPSVGLEQQCSRIGKDGKHKGSPVLEKRGVMVSEVRTICQRLWWNPGLSCRQVLIWVLLETLILKVFPKSCLSWAKRTLDVGG